MLGTLSIIHLLIQMQFSIKAQERGPDTPKLYYSRCFEVVITIMALLDGI